MLLDAQQICIESKNGWWMAENQTGLPCLYLRAVNLKTEPREYTCFSLIFQDNTLPFLNMKCKWQYRHTSTVSSKHVPKYTKYVILPSFLFTSLWDFLVVFSISFTSLWLSATRRSDRDLWASALWYWFLLAMCHSEGKNLGGCCSSLAIWGF